MISVGEGNRYGHPAADELSELPRMASRPAHRPGRHRVDRARRRPGLPGGNRAVRVERRVIRDNEGVKPAYLIHGSDSAKIDQARTRLRQRAESESGAGGLEVFEPADGREPRRRCAAASIGSLSLMPGRRYLLADRIEKWGKNQSATVAEALLAAPDETTVVLSRTGQGSGRDRGSREEGRGEDLSMKLRRRPAAGAPDRECSGRGFELTRRPPAS